MAVGWEVCDVQRDCGCGVRFYDGWICGRVEYVDF